MLGHLLILLCFPAAVLDTGTHRSGVECCDWQDAHHSAAGGCVAECGLGVSAVLQVCYILTGGLLLVCFMALTFVDIAVVYHDIRGQVPLR